MVISISQLMAFTFFFAWLILASLIGDTFLNHAVYASFLFFMWWVRRDWDWSVIVRRKLTLVAWLMFMSALFGAFLTTHSLPLSLINIQYHSFAFLFFWTFLLLKPSFLPTGWLVQGLLICTLVLCILSFFFTTLPALGNQLPGMNLVYSTYGHNHLAAWLLLMLPLSWWLTFTTQTKQKLCLGLTLFFTVFLMLSFGRVAMAIGLGQLMYILYWYLEKFRQSSLVKSFRQDFVTKVLVALISLLTLSLMVVGIFTWVPRQLGTVSCPRPELVGKLCKPLTSEPRHYYWQQVWWAVKDYPITGYGPGTFNLINLKYRQTIYVNSSYAHNAFLEKWAEGGVVLGVTFMILIGTLLGEAWRLAFSKTNTTKNTSPTGHLNQALFIGCISIVIDVLFDFDWSFIAIFTVFLLFIALILRSDSLPAKKKTQPQLNKHVLKLMMAVTIAIVAGLSLTYALVEFYIVRNQTLAAFHLFPYFRTHSEIFRKAFKPPFPEVNKLQFIYRYEPDSYHYYLSQTEDPQTRIELLQQLYQIDPWQQTFNMIAFEYRTLNDQVAVEQSLNQLYEFVTAQKKYLTYPLSSITAERVSQLYLELGDQYFTRHNYSQAGKYYATAVEFDQWALYKHPPIFITARYDEQGLDTFLQELNHISPELFGEKASIYSQLYLHAALIVLKRQQTEVSLPLLKRSLDISPWRKNEILDEVSSILAPQIKNDIKLNQLSAAQYKLEQLVAVHQLVSRYPGEITYFTEQRIAELLLEVGQLSINTQKYVLAQYYQQAAKVSPDILEVTPLWFEVYPILQTDPEEIIQFIKYMPTDLLPTEKKTGSAYAQLLTKAAAISYERQNLEQTEKYLLQLQQAQPNQYWQATILPHFYVASGQDEQARVAFETCLRIFNNQHGDCIYGQQALGNGEPNTARYQQVTQIILGEKKWEDFL